MKLEQDDKTGKWRNSSKGDATFNTRSEAKNAWIDKKLASIRQALTKIRKYRHL